MIAGITCDHTVEHQEEPSTPSQADNQQGVAQDFNTPDALVALQLQHLQNIHVPLLLQSASPYV